MEGLVTHDEKQKPVVVITGISGYIGSQVCLSFLKNGTFTVRGTVRSTKNAAKMEPLKKAYGEELYSQLELVEADLNDEESIIKACAGATYIVHTASPFVLGSKEKDLVPPAVNGTLAAMRAAHKTKVKRVIVTSSCAAIHVSKDATKMSFGPEDWSDTTITPPYEKSKTLAEQAAWKFI